MDRHENLEWQKLRVKLEEHPEKMWSLNAMEETGGEPDVLEYDGETDRYFFTTAQKKARRAEESYAMIRKRWKAEGKQA